MEDKKKLAKDWYQVCQRELQELINQHWQISLANRQHPALTDLSAKIRRMSVVCEIWRSVARYNATQRFLQGG